VTRYFSNIGVGAVKITSGSLKIGEKIHIKGNTTDFIQEVNSMQIENESVSEVKEGEEFGIKLKDRVRVNDDVYKVE